MIEWLLTHPLSTRVPNFWPAVILALGFPLVELALTEAIALCERRGVRFARTLHNLRGLVVPSLAVLLLVSLVLGLPAQGGVVRVAETVFWIAALYAIVGAFNDAFFGRAAADSWQDRVPTLLRDLIRIALVAAGGLVIYSKVWGQEVGGALTALGVGSVVIGLALQEPLGNLVSGLMLLFERPLKDGDWVRAGDVTGRVIEINWRSVHIETATRELHIVPNVSLYKSEFSNLSRPTLVRTEVVEIGFGYDDPPNRVKEVLQEMLESTPGVLATPAPVVRAIGYEDYSVTYRLIFSVATQEELWAIRDGIVCRVWYVARREGLTIPYPIQMEYGPGESPGRPEPSPAEALKPHARFAPALAHPSGRRPAVRDYARGETIHATKGRFQGFALILSGKATLQTTGDHDRPVTIGSIGPGECFGDQLTAGGGLDDVGIVAAEDLRILVFDPVAIGDLLDHSPSLAAEIGDALESRRRAAQAARRGK
jgi:small-conductance mechanosensitive channel